MNSYRHTVKIEKITGNTVIEASEGFTSIEFFFENQCYLNDVFMLSGNYSIINEPYVKMESDLKITSADGKPVGVVVVKHFYNREK
jgi:hypothetical protein